MKTKTIALSATVLLLGGIFVANTSAYQGNPNVTGPNYSQERHILMTEAFKNADYLAWKNLMSDRGNARVLEVINEQNFDKFVEIHNLMLDGKIEEAKKLRAELGLGVKNGLGKVRGNNDARDGSGFGRNR